MAWQELESLPLPGQSHNPFDEKGLLGASFFFKRGEADRNNATRFISTITKQLMTSNQELASDISRVIADVPDLSTKALSQQFDKLLLQPLLRLKLNEAMLMVIVIDALDECEQEDNVRVILQLLPKLQESKSIHLRIFLASRPEESVCAGLNQFQDYQVQALEEVPMTEHDIQLFLEDRLSKIRDDKSLAREWPGDDAFDNWVAMSVPLFIFAATVCRFIKDRPKKHLAAILESKAAPAATQMEKMYRQVLEQILNPDDKNETEDIVKEFKDIVGVICFLATPLSMHILGQFLHIPMEDISYLLNKLHSVLSVPEKIDAPVRILHLSFREFLVNTESIFHVDESETHRKILSRCLIAMNSKLKHNICGLSSYGTQHTEVDSQIIAEHLPQDVQ